VLRIMFELQQEPMKIIQVLRITFELQQEASSCASNRFRWAYVQCLYYRLIKAWS